jgi:geranylgeranyl diphosphate synthase type II
MAHELFGGDVRKVLRPALAIELFHNFTLLHDDIMDKAPLRRGKSTVHEKWNADIAILSGIRSL